jgi:hypothetical protein
VRGLRLVVLAMALAGCGNSTSVDFSSPITACRSFALAVCTVEARCQAGVDANSCSQLLEAENGCNQAGCGNGVYSPTAAQTCYNDYSSQTCADSNSSTIPASCQQSVICPVP